MSAINKFLELNRSKRINVAVVGDAMLDEYYDVTANRVSPEFPIPVMQSNTNIPDKIRPGGAANVAAQFRYLNAEVTLYSFLDKRTTSIFKDLMRNTSTLAFNYVVDSDNRVQQTPVKRRLYCNGFPLCRWDVEDKNYGTKSEILNTVHNDLQDRFKENITDVIILSDYNKGFFTEDSRNLWLKNGITIVDPKKGPASKWIGCTILKPNSKEAEDLTGLKDWKDQADYLMNETQCEVCVITQEGEGVVGKTKNGYFEFKPKKSVVAESVIGAGDCFMAFLAMAYAHEMEIDEAVEVAFTAGAVYVQRKHNESITPYDLLSYADPISAKMVDPKFFENKNFKLAFSNGCFDFGLTSGHVKCLNFAKQQGEKLVVALNSDQSVSRLKGINRPILPLRERMEIVAGLSCVDFVVSFEEDTPYELIKVIRPNIIVKGGEYKKEDIIGNDLAEVVLAPFFECLSTTDKLQKMEEDGKEKEIN